MGSSASVFVNPKRWQEVEKIYFSVLEREPHERSAFLYEACHDDSELLREVEALLARETAASAASATATIMSLPEPVPSPSSLAADLGAGLALGQTLGPYRIENLLGAGGMGRVFLALDTRLGRKVAIKISTEQFGARFEREARAISALNHPHICTLHDIGSLPSGCSYMVTELIEGETLREWLKRAPRPEHSIEVARQVLEALRAAHAAGIVHRDLKPANIMVRFDGYAKVLDFGLAKRFTLAEHETADLSVPGQVVGTIAYMSPEQISGNEIGPASDLFALGIILHEMLTGEHPWPRKTTVDTLHAILHDDPPLIRSIALARWAPIVRKLLCKEPKERYSSASGVLEALARSLTSLTGAQPEPESPPRQASKIPAALISIAVLPFVFLDDAEEHKALSLGFADALITTLGNLEDIAVAPTSAILKLAGADPARVCHELAVRYVLQATVQKLGTQWRVSLQLFDSTTRRIAFAEKYDFKLENVFDVQDEIGNRVISSLQSRFSMAVPKRNRERYSNDPEAYGEFMAGLRESTSNNKATMESAVQHLAKAVELDADFALAHATLSYSCANVYFVDPKPAWIERASHHCERALTLDPDLPEGHLARAWILWSPEKNFQHAEAIAALEKVLATQPNLERAHNRMSSICAHIGRLTEAKLAHERALQSNSKTKTFNHEYYLLYSGNFTQAVEAARLRSAEDPHGGYTRHLAVESALRNGDLDFAAHQLDSGLRDFADDPALLSLKALLHACRGEPAPALEYVHETLESPRPYLHIHHAYHELAATYATLGDVDKAMAWLQRATETGFPCASYFRVDPHLANLRGLPAFEALLNDLERKYSSLKIERL